MDKITFINNQEPALNDTNLNQIQTNVENAINATKPHQINVGEVDTDYRVNLLKTKNLFDAVLEQGTFSDVGVKSASSTNYRSATRVAVKPNTTYTFSINGVSQKYAVYYYNSEGTFINAEGLTTGTFTTPANTKYINMRCFNADYVSNYATLKIQLEEGSTATEYTPFIPNQINVDNEKYSDTINVGATEDSRSRVNILHSKNLIKPTLATTTQNGVTCTNNGDGTYTLNGTATDVCQFNIITNLNLTGTYKLSGCPSSGSQSTYYMFARNASWSKFVGDTGEGKVGTFDNTMNTLAITVANGVTCNNVVFKPMITEDTSKTYADYEPYVVPSIKVDNEEIYNKALSEYSTNEQRIGTWIDGRPLYRKVVQLPAVSTYSSNISTTLSSLGITNVSSIHFNYGASFVLNNSGEAQPIEGIINTAVLNHCWVTTTTIYRYCTNSALNGTWTITLEYTKTTD